MDIVFEVVPSLYICTLKLVFNAQTRKLFETFAKDVPLMLLERIFLHFIFIRRSFKSNFSTKFQSKRAHAREGRC